MLRNDLLPHDSIMMHRVVPQSSADVVLLRRDFKGGRCEVALNGAVEHPNEGNAGGYLSVQRSLMEGQNERTR